ncbi:ATP-binding protein [Streptomyces sp. NPDC051920]|uniref:ATP-binding protein n=1 Tax=Streptomyces sp. NPDC051920 TaxID=3155523 RepID=UPI00341E7263
MPASSAPRREPTPSPVHGDPAPGRETRAPGEGVHPADGQAPRTHAGERPEFLAPAPTTTPVPTEHARSEPPAPTGPVRPVTSAPAGPVRPVTPAPTGPVRPVTSAPTGPVRPGTPARNAPRPSASPAPAEAVPPSAPAAPAATEDVAASRTKGAHALRTTVPAHPSRVPAVRVMVAAYLTRLRLPAERVDDAVLAAGELLTNALRHGSPDRDDTITVAIDCDRRELRVSVADRSPALPAARTAGGTEESGRGLTLIAALSDDWGVAPAEPGTRGKKVWFSMVLQAVP